MTRAALLLCLCAAAAQARTVVGAHYRLEFDGDRAAATEALRVLEAAWPQYGAFFGASPVLAPGERLRVVVRRDRPGFEAAIRADKTTPPKHAGGYYWPPTRTAYLFRQPTRYYTRALLLHEAAHQFHYLARTSNLTPGASWYTEGVAEYLAWHTWDGKTLRLRELPLSLKDYPAGALADLDGGKITLEQLVDRKRRHRPLGCVLVRWLVETRPGAWAALAAKLDARRDAGASFRATVGEPKALQPALTLWLRVSQEPWSQVFNAWERIGLRRFRGEAGVVTVARVKRGARSISATLQIPARGTWRGGLLLHWTSNQRYTVATVDSGGRLRVNRRKDGRWLWLHHGSAPRPTAPGVYTLAARRDERGVRFRVGTHSVGPFALPGSALGLALEGCRLDFEDVRWN